MYKVRSGNKGFFISKGRPQLDEFGPVAHFDEVEVWAMNVHAFVLFSRLTTQWRHTNGVKTGLDYQVLFSVLDREAPSDQEKWSELFDDIQTMEMAALEQMEVDRPKP